MDYSDIGAEPDIIGSAMEIPFDDESYDMVFSTQVIEHLTEPQQMVHECFRVLKPKGVLILTGPFIGLCMKYLMIFIDFQSMVLKIY
jgi:ubiquinone/menaquinone biosynthesis C-methylase UbiE